MLPILQHHAEERGGVLLPVSPLAAECLPADLQARFPHAIHPENLALFGHLAQTLGLAPIDAMILASRDRSNSEPCLLRCDVAQNVGARGGQRPSFAVPARRQGIQSQIAFINRIY